MWLSLITRATSKETKSERSFEHIHFHNILRHFDVLAHFAFTTSESIGDYYLWSWYIGVPSGGDKRLNS